MEYIFGMLLLKRINDQFAAEQEDKQKKFKHLHTVGAYYLSC